MLFLKSLYPTREIKRELGRESMKWRSQSGGTSRSKIAREVGVGVAGLSALQLELVGIADECLVPGTFERHDERDD